MAHLQTALAGLILCALPVVPTEDPYRLGRCPHLHPAGGVVASLMIAEHPRGATAIVEICNATSRAVQPLADRRFVWEESTAPGFRDDKAVGNDRPEITPGMRLSFELELTEHYRLAPHTYYQLHYAGRFRSDAGQTTLESNEAGFALRLTD